MAGRTKPLVMVVDGNVDGLKAASQTAQRVLADLEKSGGDFATGFDKEFAKIGDSSASAIAEATKRLTADISRMRREAESAAKMGADFNPSGGFTSTGQQQLADNLIRNSALLKQQEAAYRKVAAENADMAVSASAAANNLRAHAAALNFDAEAAQRNADMLQKVEAEMGQMDSVATKTGAAVTGASGQMRAGMQQLSFQVGDVATQFAMGTPPMQIFAQQGGQVVQSLQLMTGEANGFLGFLGGPWGIAITAGVTVLGALIASLWDTGEAAEEAKTKTFDFADGLDLLSLSAKDAKTAMEQLAEEMRGAIELQGDFVRGKAAIAQTSLSDAQSRVSSIRGSIAKIEERHSSIPSISPQWIADESMLRSLRKELKEWTEVLAKARKAVGVTAVSIGQRNVEEAGDRNQAGINRVDEQIAALNSRRERSAAAETLGPMAQFSLNKESGGRAVYISQAEYEAEIGRLGDLREKYEEAQRESNRKPRSSGSGTSASPGDMVALLKELFPGVAITSTTGGKHTKGSDHYAGRAVDFVPAGGMGSISTEQVYETLKAAGIDIRRGKNGTEQFFGPGRSAAKPGDHDDHFHVAWEGKPSPESAARAAEQRAAELARDQEALTAAMLASKEDAARIAREGVTDAVELAALDKAAIDAGLARKLAANAKLDLDHAELDALDTANAEARKRAIDEELARDLAVAGLEKKNAALDAEAELLGIAMQLGGTLKERRKIAERLLEIDRQQELNAIAADLASGAITPGEAAGRTDQVNAVNAGNKKVVEEEYLGPLDAYSKQLSDNLSDMDTVIEGVAARGLQSLEDGLIGLVSGTESVASAFKKMAASIIADLARIAVQKAILAIFAFKDGTVPGFATGNVPGFADGVISGPGSGTSDSILALHQGMGLIRVSNGESIITAEGTRKHRRLLKAINDNSLPAFAEGMVGGGAISGVSYPSIPSSGALRAAGSGMPAQYFDLRGAVVTEQLYRDMHQLGAQYAAQALAAAPGLTRQELGEASMQQIPT